MIERHLIAEQNVLTLARLAQFVLRAAAHDVHAVLDKELEQLQQAQFARLSGHDRQQDHAEGFLHLRHLEKLVEDDFGLFVALDFDHDAHAVAVAFVADVGDAVDFLVLDQLGDVLDQPRFVHLIRQLGDDDVLAVLATLLDGGLGAHLERSAAGPVSLLDSIAAVDVARRREIRAGDDLHQLLQGDFGILDQLDAGLDDFRQIVRRNVGRHADGDSARAVDQEIRNSRRENPRFFAGLVEVVDEIDRLLVDVREHFLGDLRKAGFGISHRRRRVAVDRAEVALPVDQRIAHAEILREPDERRVNHRLTVRMIIARGIAADLRALAEASVRREAEIVHRDQDAALHRLEAVADIGNGARQDYAHRVIEVRLLHFRFDIDRRHDRLVLLVSH